MDIETLKTIVENGIPNLMLVMEIVALIAGFFASAGLVIYLIGIALLCLGELRESSRRRSQAPLNRSEPDRGYWPAVVVPNRNKPDSKLSRRALSIKGSA